LVQGKREEAILVRLLALRSGLTLMDWDIATKWDDQIVAESFDSRSPIYKLGPQEYRQCEVLNQKIEGNLRLRRGQIVEGWILANGLRPIPAEYHDCSTAPFEVRFLDQFRCQHRAQGTFSVLRKAQRDKSTKRKGSGLYGLDATGKPPEPSVGEAARRRYLDLLAQEKGCIAAKVSGGDDSRGNCVTLNWSRGLGTRKVNGRSRFCEFWNDEVDRVILSAMWKIVGARCWLYFLGQQPKVRAATRFSKDSRVN
jgi:hypothetical protein